MTDYPDPTAEELRARLENPPPAEPSDDGSSAPPDEPETKVGEIWPGCPVIPLGVFGECCFYLDVWGQLRAIDNHTAQKIMHLFGHRQILLENRFPQYDRQGKRRSKVFNAAHASRELIEACAKIGVWSPTSKVRGPGCWTDEDGGLVIHAGDAVFLKGKWCAPGVHHGKVYAADDAIPRPLDKPQRAHRGPGEKLLEQIQTWNWRRPDVDPHLILGLICAQMLGGALDWRPVGWLTGDRSTGKSTFQKLLLHVHGGEAGLKQAADATEAGIRSVVGNSCIPVAVDELEPDADNPNKVKAVIELARRASSGAVIMRGSSDQKGHQSKAFSCFLFSSILVPPMPSQDRSRLVLLDLDRLEQGAEFRPPDPRTLRGWGAGIRRRLLDQWEVLPARMQAFREVMTDAGHSARAVDNFGTLLALAHIALSNDAPAAGDLERWATKISVEALEDLVDQDDNATDMLVHLLSQDYDVWRRGERYSIAQWLMAAAVLPGAPAKLKGLDKGEANNHLSKIGIRVRGTGRDAEILLANKPVQGLKTLFEGSNWASGVWSQAAKRINGASLPPNPLRFAGVSSRATAVPIASIPGLLAFPTETVHQRPTAPAGGERVDAQYPPDLEDF